MEGMAIEVSGSVKSYGGLTDIDGVSFDVRTGGVFSLRGLNGIGKTMAVEVMERVLSPVAGQVLMLGLDGKVQGP